MPLSNRQLARLRSKALTFLKETADISRLVDGTDASGVPTQYYADPHVEDVACRVVTARNQGTAGWAEIGQADAMVDMYQVTFPAGTDVTEDCRVVVGERLYRVIEVVDDLTDQIYMHVHAKRIRGNDDVSGT